VSALADLVALLDVETLDTDLYRGARHPGGKGRVFGGQVIAQALMAASRSAPIERPPHSLHAYFMRPGDEAKPIIYRVERDFDGGTFSTRRVIAMQDGRPILNLTGSFQRPEDGLAHNSPMPEVPGPDALPTVDMADSRAPVLAHFLSRFGAFEFRPVDPLNLVEKGRRPAVNHGWFRLRDAPPADPAVVAALLAYISDLGLLPTTTLPHGLRWFAGELQVASLDHALWLHRAAPLDRWLLYTMESPWADAGRGLARGAIFTEAGERIASVAQEGLIRPVRSTTS
jgi:acyl-CoA thioesterase II